MQKNDASYRDTAVNDETLERRKQALKDLDFLPHYSGAVWGILGANGVLTVAIAAEAITHLTDEAFAQYIADIRANKTT